MSLRNARTLRSSKVPCYPDTASRLLGEQLERARLRREELRKAGAPTDEVEREIQETRRMMREGGQLREGDALGDCRYLLIERIGQGGFAVVWRALDRERDALVAVKVLHASLALDPAHRARFFKASRAMAQLTHPAVVRVLAPEGEEDGFHYFVLELMPGGDLRQAVLDKRVLPQSVLPLILRVGEALAEAHARGVLHRDVKPSNILLDERGEAKLSDFDLVAPHVSDAPFSSRSGALSAFVYAAPESLDREQEVDERGDVYSLGVAAVFCLRGAELTVDLVKNPGWMIEQLPCTRAVQTVLKKAIAWSRKDRYANAGALCTALKNAVFLRQETGSSARRRSSPPPSTTEAATSEEASPKGVKGRLALGLSALAIVAAGVYGLTQRSEARSAADRSDGATLAASAPAGLLGSSAPAPAAPAGAPASAAPAAASAAPFAEDVPAAASALPDEASRCPEGMAMIPGGRFTMGADDPSDEASPPHTVELDDYCIDRKEVTVAQYRACMGSPRAGVSCNGLRPGKLCNGRALALAADGGELGAHPVNCVDWKSAALYCRWVGGRLPTEAEWEHAARHASSPYPWGASEPAEQLCWRRTSASAELGTCAVGSFPRGGSWRGVLDLSGNVAEWTQDRYGPYSMAAAHNPLGAESGYPRVVRGGSWRDDSSAAVRATHRRAVDPTTGNEEIGFRCVRPPLAAR